MPSTRTVSAYAKTAIWRQLACFGPGRYGLPAGTTLKDAYLPLISKFFWFARPLWLAHAASLWSGSPRIRCQS